MSREDSRYEEVDDGDVQWRFERALLASRWACIWDRGCKGILDHPAPELGQGCCSVGARIEDADEARLVAANAAILDPARFQHHELARTEGVFADDTRSNTRVVDGACIFLNRPGYSGGAGCALHLAALDFDESPIDWKPSVCWRLPMAIDWDEADGRTRATVRTWTRSDWGSDGEAMAWWCTEEAEAHTADSPFLDRMGAELTAISGDEVVVELRHRLR